MEFGFNFDDELFTEAKDRTHIIKEPYDANIHNSEWFTKAELDGSIEDVNKLKFCADLAYRNKKYSSALTMYNTCLDLLKTTAIPLYKEFYDSITRCYTHMGNQTSALMMCEKTVSDVNTIDQMTHALKLQCFVAHKFGLLLDCVTYSEKLCILHPGDPNLWMYLSDLYSEILLDKTIKYSCKTYCQCMEKQEGSLINTDPTDDSTCRSCLLLVQLTCISKLQVLLKCLHRNVNSFAKERNKTMQNKADKAISENLNCIPEPVKTKCYDFISDQTYNSEEDVTTVGEKYLLSLLETSEKVFKDKWLSWMC